MKSEPVTLTLAHSTQDLIPERKSRILFKPINKFWINYEVQKSFSPKFCTVFILIRFMTYAKARELSYIQGKAFTAPLLMKQKV
jgi:hypothetical protein